MPPLQLKPKLWAKMFLQIKNEIVHKGVSWITGFQQDHIGTFSNIPDSYKNILIEKICDNKSKHKPNICGSL